MRPYQDYATVYDRTGQSRFSLRMLRYARDLWGGNWPQSLVDVACGTGAAAVALALRNVTVVGVDQSPQMLAKARERADRWGAKVDWLQQDYRSLEVPGSFEAATCFYDAINYCHSVAELEAVFGGLAACVQPGGRLLVDAITDYGIRYIWGNSTEAKVDPDIVRIWRTSFDPTSGLGRLDATYLTKRKSQRDAAPQAQSDWVRFDETHIHRGFDPLEMNAALAATGWETLGTYRCLSLEPATATAYRVAYHARRR